jgi:hypothetical protein
MKIFWKILTVVLFWTLLLSFLIDFSMFWWPSIPSSPRPAEGRVYPLNNHGTYTYMNRWEYLLDERLKWGFFVGIAALAAIQFLMDPFDYKRRPRQLRPPRPW